jgi:GT2 family glycosyltransferase
MTAGPAAPRLILHVDLDGDVDEVLPAPSADPPPADALLVLWSGEVPVGQLVVPTEQLPVSRADPRLAAARRAAASRVRPETAPVRVADDVTVVICTRDRTEWLARCLAALGRSTAQPAEVIVVDNAPSSDGTRVLVGRTPGVRYVLEPRPGLDVARNAGLRAATTEFVAYTDDDAEAHRDWTWRIRQAFDDPSIVAVTGLVLPAELDTDAQVLFEDHAGFGRGYARRDFDPDFLARHRRWGAPVWEIGAGANMAFRRGAVAAVGGFDERLGAGAAGCSDDSEMWHRLLETGGRCRYEPTAVVHHHHRRTHEELLQQMYFYMRGHACALLVQFERHRGRGDLARLFLVLPKWYGTTAAKVLVRRLRGAPRAADALLAPQVRGWLAGVLFYLRSRRPAATTEPNG